MTASGKSIVIGLGSIGMQLLRLLSRDLELICVDLNPQTLEAAREIRGNQLAVCQGDAASRLVLEKLGVDSADAVVITTTSETVNIEVARVLREHFQPRRLLAVGITQKGIETLEALGVEVVSIFNLSATGLRNRLEQKTKAVEGIGLGKNEILEVEVHVNSRLANKPLASLNPKSWRVGIIYRDGNIIIPRGDTILRAKDRIIILGDPKVLRTVAELLTFRFTHFPLEYGDTLVAWFGGREAPEYLEEIGYLLSVFPITKAFFLLGRETPGVRERLEEICEGQRLQDLEVKVVDALPLEAFRDVILNRRHRACLLVLPRQLAVSSPFSPPGRHGGKGLLRQLAGVAGCPLVVAAGTFPYEQVAVPCLEEEGLEHAMETTLEMSAAIKYGIDALFVRLSPYIASEEEGERFKSIKKMISDLALIYKADVRSVELEGNPVRASVEAVSEHNLVVSAIGGWRQGGALKSLLQPDPSWEVIRRSPVSALLIPPMEIIV